MIRPTEFDGEMFKRYRLHIPKHIADEVRAAELLANHERKINMQRRAMDSKMIPAEDVNPKKTEPKKVPLALVDGTKIGEATIHFEDHILKVDEVVMNGDAAILLGVNLSLYTIYNPLGSDDEFLAAGIASNVTTDLKNTEVEH